MLLKCGSHFKIKINWSILILTKKLNPILGSSCLPSLSIQITYNLETQIMEIMSVWTRRFPQLPWLHQNRCKDLLQTSINFKKESISINQDKTWFLTKVVIILEVFLTPILKSKRLKKATLTRKVKLVIRLIETRYLLISKIIQTYKPIKLCKVLSLVVLNLLMLSIIQAKTDFKCFNKTSLKPKSIISHQMVIISQKSGVVKALNRKKINKTMDVNLMRC